jgi:hypothetical protein
MDKDIFWHELNAYKTEILSLQAEIERSIANFGEIQNLTHFSLGVSNRANLMVVGLCSLVEVFLYELSAREEDKTAFKIEDLKGNGLERLQTYLTRTGKVDFGKIPQWSTFKQIYVLRNALIHSYGGLIETSFIEKVKKAIEQLKIESALVGNRRIRLTSEILLDFHKLIEDLISELKLTT